MKEEKRNIELNSNIRELLEKNAFNHMYSVKRILSLPSTIGKINNYNYFIKNLEYYYNYLIEKDEITSLNLSNIGITMFDYSNEIKEHLLNKDMSNADDFEILKKEIDNNLAKLDIKTITNNSKMNMEIETKDKSNKDLTFRSNTGLEEYIIKLIDSYNYPYSDYMEKFFSELNYDNILKFKKTKFTKELKFTEQNIIYLLNTLNLLFNQVCNVLDKKGNFIYEFVQICFFYSESKAKEIIIQILLEKVAENIRDHSYNYKTENIDFMLMRNFHDGLFKIRDFYIIEYKDYTNYTHINLRHHSIEQQFKLITDILKDLNKKNVYTVFQIANLTLSEILEKKYLIKDIESVIKDLKKSKLDITIKKQELLENNQNIIDNFIVNIDIYKKTYKDFIFKNITITKPQIGSKINLLLLDLEYNNVTFNVKISQLNLELFTYIYFDKKIINKEWVFRIEDLDRIFIFIKTNAYKYKNKEE